MKPLKFHWALGLGVNISIIILIVINIFIATYLFEKVVIQEALKVRLDRNYKWAYFSLIQGHTILPINIYKTVKQDYSKEVPNIKIFRSEKVEELFGKGDPLLLDNNLLKALNNENNTIIIDKEKSYIWIFFCKSRDFLSYLSF